MYYKQYGNTDLKVGAIGYGNHCVTVMMILMQATGKCSICYYMQ